MTAARVDGSRAATLATLRDAIARIEAGESPSDLPVEFCGETWCIFEDPDTARLCVRFDGPPSGRVRGYLIRQRFKWAPVRGRWQKRYADTSRKAGWRIARRLNDLMAKEQRSGPGDIDHGEGIAT